MSEVVTLEANQSAPRFSCLDSAGKEQKLESYMADGKSVILYFYPRDSTPGCTVQACDFRDSMSRLNQGDYVVLGVSKDSVKSHDNFISKQDLNFPLLMEAARDELHKMLNEDELRQRIHGMFAFNICHQP